MSKREHRDRQISLLEDILEELMDLNESLSTLSLIDNLESRKPYEHLVRKSNPAPPFYPTNPPYYPWYVNTGTTTAGANTTFNKKNDDEGCSGAGCPCKR